MNKRVYDAIKNGRADNNINFSDFQNLIIDLGFIYKRQDGSHKIYRHKIYNAIMIIQADGNKAKGYQVRQLKKLIEMYNL